MLGIALGLCVASAVPLGVDAQTPGKPFRLGILRQTSPSDPLTSVMRAMLAEVGYVDGQNITIDWRFADG
jgi:hypothetical protein